jgi:hypothetical protein
MVSNADTLFGRLGPQPHFGGPALGFDVLRLLGVGPASQPESAKNQPRAC